MFYKKLIWCFFNNMLIFDSLLVEFNGKIKYIELECWEGLCYRSVSALMYQNYITFQSLYHIFSGVSQSSGTAFEFCKSICNEPCFSGSSSDSFIFKMIELFLQSEQILQIHICISMQQDIQQNVFFLRIFCAANLKNKLPFLNTFDLNHWFGVRLLRSLQTLCVHISVSELTAESI